MANITITSTTNSIKVSFGAYYPILTDIEKGTWRKSFIMDFALRADGILVDIEGQIDWLVSFDGSNGTYQIDSVDGVAPTSNSDLFTKLEALIA